MILAAGLLAVLVHGAAAAQAPSGSAPAAALAVAAVVHAVAVRMQAAVETPIFLARSRTDSRAAALAAVYPPATYAPAGAAVLSPSEVAAVAAVALAAVAGLVDQLLRPLLSAGLVDRCGTLVVMAASGASV